MASTYADRTLVAGAYAAAGGNIKDKGLEAAQGLTDIGGKILSGVGKRVQQRRDRFEQFANNELQRKAGELNDVEFDELERTLRKRKEQFAWSGKKDQGMMMREMEQQKKELDGLNEVRNDFANSGSEEGDTDETFDDDFKVSDVSQSMMDAFESAPITLSNGELGYEIWFPENGGTTREMNETQLRKFLDEKKFDLGSRDALMASLDKAFNDAKQNMEFNYPQTELNIRQNIVEKGKIESLINREMIPGRTFYDDLQEGLTNGTYEELGVLDENVVDPTPNTPITPEDAKIITDELIKDEDLTKDYLTKYYTNFIIQNFNHVKRSQSSPEVGIGPLGPSLTQAGKDYRSAQKPIWEGGEI